MLLMVLNDGETFTDLAGCMILDVPDDFEGDDLAELSDARKELYRFGNVPPSALTG